jgi:DNA polymerase IV
MTHPPLAILHIDMDAFYASVEQRDRPELRGLPVIVGGPLAGRGVVSAASYEARAFGVHSAMPMATARRLCPGGIFLPVRMNHYAAIGRQLRDIFRIFTALVEPLSLDEAFLDVRGSVGHFGPATTIARLLKEKVKAETGLVASVGLAPNKYLAKLACDLGKPDGLFVILPQDVQAVLDPLPVSRLWGVGAKGQRRLHDLGLRTIGQLAAIPERLLVKHFGEVGRLLWNLAHGRDDRPVTPDEKARSISNETTFPRDVGDRDALRACLLELIEEIGGRLRAQGARARLIELKARTADFKTYSRSLTFPQPTDLTAELRRAAVGMLENRVPDSWLPLRLLGVGVSGLVRSGAVQGDLFEGAWRKREQALDQTVDTIRAKFGGGAIRRGTASEG